MISESEARDLIGASAYDSAGDKIGKIGQVYFDDQTGSPEWVTVNTGFFGTNESFVPLREATFEDGDLRVPYAKSLVKDAPNIDETAHLDPEEEDELYRYYGVGTPEVGLAEAPNAGSPAQQARLRRYAAPGETGQI
jgi:sporulation protein YlmC with PRC-barrel domain